MSRSIRWIAFLLGLMVLLTAGAGAQGAGTITGTVYDSLAHKPLAGAVVDLAAVPNIGGITAATTSDSLGHYQFAGVPQGTYILGFFHPRLDSLGIEAPIQQVRVGAGPAARSDLAIPGAKRIHDAVCHASDNPDSTGMLVGHVQNAATGSLVEGATVTAQWALLSAVDRQRTPHAHRPHRARLDESQRMVCLLQPAVSRASERASGVRRRQFRGDRRGRAAGGRGHENFLHRQQCHRHARVHRLGQRA